MHIVQLVAAAVVARMPLLNRRDAPAMDLIQTFQDFKVINDMNITVPPNQKCGDQWYSPFEYSCYDNELLCSWINGLPMKRCGNGCYLPYEYGCTNGALTELPPATSPFELMGVSWLNVAAAKIQACSNKFYMKDGGPCTYCPVQVGKSCPPGLDTVLTSPSSMHTLVPGGQRYYVDPKTGALQFTVPHSGAIPQGAIMGIDAKENGMFKVPGSNGWLACPQAANATNANNNSSTRNWQIFAQLPNIAFVATCLPINILTMVWPQNLTAAAWEYI